MVCLLLDFIVKGQSFFPLSSSSWPVFPLFPTMMQWRVLLLWVLQVVARGIKSEFMDIKQPHPSPPCPLIESEGKPIVLVPRDFWPLPLEYNKACWRKRCILLNTGPPPEARGPRVECLYKLWYRNTTRACNRPFGVSHPFGRPLLWPSQRHRQFFWCGRML